MFRTPLSVLQCIRGTKTTGICFCDISTYSTYPVSIDGFLPNFCHWCILVWFWGQKVKGQGHIIAVDVFIT